MTYATAYTQGSFVADLGHALLASAVASLSDPPTIQYLAMGKPAADGCDQLVVWVDALQSVRPAGSISNTLSARDGLEPGGVLPAVEFNVQLLRCGAPQSDGGLLPTPAVLDAHGVELLTDAWELYRGLLARYASGSLFGTPNPIPAHHTVIRDMDAYGPEGGVSGWTVPIRVSLY